MDISYFSLNKKSPDTDFRQAMINGQAPDKGLYFPSGIPILPADFMATMRSKSKATIAFEVIRPYVGGTIPDDELFAICAETIDFPFPLVQISKNIYALELFHGPTLAFKDVGARFMSRCLTHFARQSAQKITILVATSGDTGSAVANGFLRMDGIEVVILYPSGKVSKIQELQLTTLGQNITALEVGGTFDDCQRMVKDAFMDKDLNNTLSLTSANSINIARWLSQQFYYFFAMQQWDHPDPPVVCVPSGNFGNICAGLLAQRSGLPVKHFIAACNSNKVFTEYIQSGSYAPKHSVPTLSNAMDVGDPSNFVRILHLFDHQYNSVRERISSFSINDEETARTIRDVYSEHNYMLDPHGAIAYASLEKYLSTHPGEKGIILETAHPVKFEDIEEKILGFPIAIPDSIKPILSRKKESILINPDFEELKSFLKSRGS